MDSILKTKLQNWAAQYNQPDFIKNDPILFPHRFKKKQDIEISGFLSSWMSYGKREQILAKCEIVHQIIGNNPYEFIRKGPASFVKIKKQTELKDSRCTLYRFYTYEDLYQLLCRLHSIYEQFESLEEAVINIKEADPARKLSCLFEGVKGIPSLNGNSARKRIAMFLRWMVRQDGIVDLGIWKKAASPKDLIIPLDTHVHRISIELGLTSRKDATWKTAEEITKTLAEIFPEDPCLGDFALFGIGIQHTTDKQHIESYKVV